MRKIITVIAMAALLLSSTAITSCTQYALEATIKSINKSCPAQLAEGLTLLKATTDSSTLYYNVNFDEEIVDAQGLRDNQDGIREAFMEEFRQNVKTDKSVESLVGLCQSENMMIVYRFQGQRSHEVIEISIDPQLIK